MQTLNCNPVALISVYDKRGIVELCQSLQEAGWRLISTGGTYDQLTASHLTVEKVSNITQFPELLNGRVKTLHPNIHAGILARGIPEHEEQLVKYNIPRINLVVCNLYPFSQVIEKSESTWDLAIENIDIGGVTLLRAAAKNHEQVVVLSNPNDYTSIGKALIDQTLNLSQRKKLAHQAFLHTFKYDQVICQYFQQHIDQDQQQAISSNKDQTIDKSLSYPDQVQFSFTAIQPMRYGENPHQSSCLYMTQKIDWIDPNHRPMAFNPLPTPPWIQLAGKELSYNNFLDIDAALGALDEFQKKLSTVVIIKHLTPCGIASDHDPIVAFQRALDSDPVSAFGSIIAVNFNVTLKWIEKIGSLFVEVLLLPSIDDDALALICSKKKNCRVMLTKPSPSSLDHNPKLSIFQDEPVIRSIRGGAILIQSQDRNINQVENWKVVTEKKPTNEQLVDLDFAWRSVKHVKSNAITFVKNQATIGIGCGQPNRLESVKLAASFAKDKTKGAVCASDAFFPFPDTVEEAAKYGIVAIVQPGGSIRDQMVIDKANELGMIMMFTGERHFKH